MSYYLSIFELSCFQYKNYSVKLHPTNSFFIHNSVAGRKRLLFNKEVL